MSRKRLPQQGCWLPLPEATALAVTAVSTTSSRTHLRWLCPGLGPHSPLSPPRRVPEGPTPCSHDRCTSCHQQHTFALLCPCPHCRPTSYPSSRPGSRTPSARSLLGARSSPRFTLQRSLHGGPRHERSVAGEVADPFNWTLPLPRWGPACEERDARAFHTSHPHTRPQHHVRHVVPKESGTEPRSELGPG